MPARIRFADESDATAIAEIYRPIVESTTISFETMPPDREEMARRVAETTREHPWLACDIGGRGASHAYAPKHRGPSPDPWSGGTSGFRCAPCRPGRVAR